MPSNTLHKRNASFTKKQVLQMMDADLNLITTPKLIFGRRTAAGKIIESLVQFLLSSVFLA